MHFHGASQRQVGKVERKASRADAGSDQSGNLELTRAEAQPSSYGSMRLECRARLRLLGCDRPYRDESLMPFPHETQC